jgi:site-specific recombinase XerD
MGRRANGDSLVVPLHRFDSDGRLSIFQFRNHPEPRVWYMKALVNVETPQGKRRRSKPIIRSLKTVDRQQAFALAETAFRTLKANSVLNRPLFVFTMAEGVRKYLKHLARSETVHNDKERARKTLENYVIPFFSERYRLTPIADIKTVDVAEFNKWRETQGLGKRGEHERKDANGKPLPATVDAIWRESRFLAEFFDYARAQGWTDEKPLIRTKKPPRNKRPDYLTKDEWGKIDSFLETWGDENRNKLQAYYQRLAACAFRLLWSTGMRPGTELWYLTWRNVNTDKQGILLKLDHSKTGPRNVRAPRQLEMVLNRLAQLTKGVATWQDAKDQFQEEPLFQHWPQYRHLAGKPVKAFLSAWHECLKAPSVNLFRKGRRNQINIIRHSYITHALEAGFHAYWVANNCGHKLAVLEDVYSHAIHTRFDPFANVQAATPLGLPWG